MTPDEGAAGERLAAFRARRDEASFVALYRHHAPALMGFALRLLSGRRGEAEEVVQETWVRAVSDLERFDGRAAFRSWLCGIAVNVYRERVRRRQRQGPVVEPVAPALAPSTDTGGARIDLARAVARLPDGCREVLLLHDVEGYTHREIGALLEVDPGTSKSQLSRARALVRGMLAGPQRGETRSA